MLRYFCPADTAKQYMPRKASPTLKLKIGDEPEITETGAMFCEATFITDSTTGEQ